MNPYILKFLGLRIVERTAGDREIVYIRRAQY